jgi:hypothetical protein
LELGRVPTSTEVKEKVKRQKVQRKKEREDVRHARHVGGAQAKEWWQKMEERQEAQSKKLDTLETLLRDYIKSQVNKRTSDKPVESTAVIPDTVEKCLLGKGKSRQSPSP